MAFGVCVLLFAACADERGFRAVLRARRDTQALAGRIGSLRAENAALRRRAEALRRDGAAIESEARQALGLVRPGEILVTLERR